MSTSAPLVAKPPRGPDVLDELLHSLSQPLTSLRCSLELSIDEAVEQQQESVAAALRQTEEVMGVVRLMREYLDADQPELEICEVALSPALRSVVDDLSSVAAVRGIELQLTGNCAVTLPVQEARLRLVLQYLIASMIETQPTGGEVMLRLDEGPLGTVLRVEGEHGFRELPGALATLRRVRLAIASRVLEAAGAAVVFGGRVPCGFVLRIPRGVGS